MTSIEETKALAPWTETLPSDWRATRLDAVADVIFSNVDKHTIEGEVPVRLCNYVDVYKNERITCRLDFMEASAELREIKKFQIQRGDVLATKDSEEADDIAISALVAEDLPGVICGYHLALIRPRFSTVSGPFLAWLHSSKSFRAQYEANAVGVTRFGLSQYSFKAARVPLPPFHEQQRIAAYLDASCAAIDTAVSAKRRQLDTIDNLRKVIISKAVTQGLAPADKQVSSGKEWIGPVPAHWKLGKLKHLTSLIVDGTHITPTYLPSGVPFLRVTDIQEEEINLNNVKFISEEEHTILCQRSKAQRGDILLSKNGTIGITKVVDWDWKFSFFVSLCLLRPLKKLNPKYFQYFFESSVVDQQLFESSKKTSVTNLHLVKIRELLITMPPIKEQELIIQYLDEKCNELSQIKLNISDQIQRIQDYRKSLIHECVTGQRRVMDADVALARRGREAK